ENINFNGKNIVVGSLYLTNQDTSYISSTVIDGNQNATVVTIESGEDSTCELVGLTIMNGNDGSGGGIYCAYSSPLLRDLIVVDNSAVNDGGGIYIYQAEPSINTVKVNNNTATNGGGISISLTSGDPRLFNAKVMNNTATDNGGGIWCNNSTLDLTNTLIVNNAASLGGGIYQINSPSHILNNTIVNNIDNGNGSNIWSDDASPLTLINSIIWQDIETEIWEGWGIAWDISGASPSVYYCDVSQSLPLVFGDGNIYLDPLFGDSDNGDYNLSNYSPCIGSGIDSVQIAGIWYYALSTDIDSNPRPNPPGSNPDLGAYENPLAVPLHNSFIHVSTTGNDTGSVGLESAPFRHIQSAIDYSEDTDTVIVHPGTYIENINFNGKNIVVGSLFLTTQDTSYISSTIIDGNQAGSVVTFENGEDSSASLIGFTVQNGTGTFHSNDTRWYGGGIYCKVSSPNIFNLIVRGNSSNEGGGVFIWGASPFIKQSIIKDNTATSNNGGGILLWDHSNPRIKDVEIVGNTAWDYGGGIYFDNSDPIIKNAIISGNNAQSMGGLGGGGGIYCRVSSPVFINSTIVNNIAPNGAGLYSFDADPVILNSIIWDDPQSGVYEVYFQPNGSVGPSSITISYSDIQGGQGAIATNGNGSYNWLSGNIDLYPGFVDSANGNYRLAGTSPCIGAGTDSVQIDGSWYYAPASDIEGNPRPNPPDSNPDMGAYENPLAEPLHNSFIHVASTGNDTGSVGLETAPFKHIQSGIDYSIDGDTVLVHPGTYIENINFNGKNIVLGSLFLTTQDTSYISSTVIDGNQNGSVVTFENGEDSTAVLSGMTITNGTGNLTPASSYTSRGGGGIYCINNSSPMLSYLDITGNSTYSGGGIYLHSNSSPTLFNLIVDGNSASNDGGGIYCDSNSNPSLEIVTISRNTAIANAGGIFCNSSSPSLRNVAVLRNTGYWGAGIYLYANSSPSLMSVTIAGNSTTTDGKGGGILCWIGSNPSLVNTVLWNDSPHEIYFHDMDNPNSITIGFSNIRGGESGIVTNNNGTVNWLDGNIDADPLFVDPANSNYHLTDYSPCIGAGTSEGAPTTDIEGNLCPDPAGSNPDMGAYENPLPSQLPQAQSIRDGFGEDLSWTNSATVLSANWDPFIDDSTITYECAIGIGDSAINEFLDWTTTGTDTFVTITGLSLTSGTTYYISLCGTDIHGQMSDTVTTDGILVDLVNPLIGDLWDGDSGGDIDWQSDTTSFSIYWTGSDSRAISNYQSCLGTVPGDSNTVDWTDNGTSTTAIINDLSLISGITYYASVRATDDAGNYSAVATTDGCTVDAVAPLAGAVEDYLEYSGSGDTLLISWSGFSDVDSDIDHYQYALGTSVGGSNTVYWTEAALDTLRTLSGLNLNSGAIYYTSVKAVDLAGNWSSIVSSDGVTIDLSVPVTGIVNDGQSADIDWSNSPNSVSGNWSGFSDGISGIDYYEYAVGTSTGTGDLIDWTYNGIDINFDSTGLTLASGTTYYISIRATDQVGNQSAPVSSDGVLIDLVNPLIGDLWDGDASGDIDWQSDTTSYSIYWTGSDLRTIANYQYCLGNTPGDSNVFGWIDNGTESSVTVTGLNLTLGNTYYANVRAIDEAGNWSDIESTDGATIDYLAPITGQVFDDLNGNGEYYANTDSLIFNWTGFYDEHSGIDHYELAVGTNPGSDDVYQWESTFMDSVYGIAGITLIEGITYYASVRAIDRIGNQSAVVSTDGLTIDVSGPVAGMIINGFFIDIGWTNSTDSLTASWWDFEDAISGIEYYEYSIGTGQGETDITNWTNSGLDSIVSVTNLSLVEGQTYFWNLRAVDLIGNVSGTISTNGIGVDWTAPVINTVFEGSMGEDWDYFAKTDSLLIHVDSYSDDNSGINYFEWAIGTTPGNSDVFYWKSYMFTESVVLTGYSLIEGTTYYAAVRANDWAGNRAIFAGDGIIPDITPPELGIVNDGPAEDLDYSSSDTTASANWSGFTDNLSGITSYEYALGTQAGAVDIVAFTDCSLLTSIEVAGLSLDHGQTYYFSVRATDLVENTSDIASSNGFVVDKYAGPPVVTVITPTPFELAPALSDLSITLELSEPIRDYSLTVSSHDNSGYSYVSEYLDTPPRVNISLTGSLPYADTLSIMLNDYDDLVGLVGDTVEIEYYMPYLADFNQDWAIDVLDLAEFAGDWSSAELVDPVTQLSNEFGPITGNVPYFNLDPDSLFNIRDVMGFTRMWNWSHQQQPPALLATGGSFGEQPAIEQRGRDLLITLPGSAEAGQVVIQYHGITTDINCSTEDGTTNRILLKDKNIESSRLLVEYAYLLKSSAKSIMLETKALTRDNSNLMVYYTLYSENTEVVSQGSQEIELVAVPDQFALHQNYPNPFNPITTINYDLPENGNVSLIIYDILGRQVIQLTNEFQEAGYKSIMWNGRNASGQLVSAGMYFYAIEAGKYSAIRKMILLK
nr:right-handed parallel beta-helix repeat-containing protein [Candidatus Neomarinimicrobiota bacterium]